MMDWESMTPQEHYTGNTRYVVRPSPHKAAYEAGRASGDFDRWYSAVNAAQDSSVWDLDGVRWNQAPLPPRRHKCWAQTDQWLFLNQTQYCACGGIRTNNSHGISKWHSKNLRQPLKWWRFWE